MAKKKTGWADKILLPGDSGYRDALIPERDFINAALKRAGLYAQDESESGFQAIIERDMCLAALDPHDALPGLRRLLDRHLAGWGIEAVAVREDKHVAIVPLDPPRTIQLLMSIWPEQITEKQVAALLANLE